MSAPDIWPPISVASYRFRPLGHAQLNVPSSGVVNLTNAVDSNSNPVAIPPDANMVLVSAEVAGVRWTDDGQTPSVTFGIAMSAGQEFAYSGNLNAIQFAAVSSTPIVHLAYYK